MGVTFELSYNLKLRIWSSSNSKEKIETKNKCYLSCFMFYMCIAVDK